MLYCIDGRISEANLELDSEAMSEANRQHASVEPGLLGGFLNFDEKVATVLYVLGCVPVTMILSGWLLYMYDTCSAQYAYIIISTFST